MKVTETSLPGVLLIEPRSFGDPRGYFLETWQQQRYADVGIALPFVQDNLSRSRRGILRGLHLQHPTAQGKLVYVVEGEVFDVAVDVRVGSPTFGVFTGVSLSETDHRQLWIPPGFAHGFCVTSETAVFAYKCTAPYEPRNEVGVLWNDPSIGIPWPIGEPLLSDKDRAHRPLSQIDASELPRYEISPPV